MNNSYSWRRLTADAKVSTRPVLLSLVVIRPPASKKATVSLYDGESTADPQIMMIRTLSGESKAIQFAIPLETQRGLYVDFVGDCDEVFVLYKALDE